ncbi:MAG: DUF2508 family protein [Firmicutes bacterium]|nr:DUF2508 family protein [Bacillota bacterium]
MPSTADLVSDVHRARQAWQDAVRMLDFVAPEFLDYAIFHLDAAERRFMALLREARREGVTAWAEERLRPPLGGGTAEPGPPATGHEAEPLEPACTAPSAECE